MTPTTSRSRNPNIFLTGHPGCGKTTIIKFLQASLEKEKENKRNIITKGFYTEECRNKGGERIGFDILYWTAANSTTTSSSSSNPKRQALSRVVDKIKKGQPHVGKYLVNVPNIEKFAVLSLLNDSSSTSSSSKENNTDNCSSSKKELILVDEVGKMEMLCPKFIPAVNKLLDDEQQSSTTTTATTTTATTRLVIGTIPTPRYGRVIQAVEDIRARDDVIVLHVTKANRDELKSVLYQVVRDIFILNQEETTTSTSSSSSSSNNNNLVKVLKPFLYQREIGASSMTIHKGGNDDDDNNSSKNNNNNKSTSNVGTCADDSIPKKACGPLYSDSDTANLPKILLLGETASPLPSNVDYSYCERSMWIVFGKMFGITYKPIKDINSAKDTELKAFVDLKSKVLDNGICIWDVYSNVHERSGEKKRKRRHKKNTKDDADSSTIQNNNIDQFLKKYPTIELIGFIGQKARSSYDDTPSTANNKTKKVELITLPSSSPANSRLSVQEKADLWKREFSKFIPELA